MSLTIKKRESSIEDHFTRQCKAEGWLVRKYVTPGHNGAPDRIVFAGHNVVGWAELKRPGKDLEEHQVIEIRKMRERGAYVLKVDGIADIAQFVATMRRMVEARREVSP